MADKPNILLLFTDDQRFDTISALGNPALKTPNMDRLANTGLAFTHAHIPGGTVGAVCMPSRAMLHTGRTLFHIQDAGKSIPADHATLGETFQEAGYRTFGTGKWHNGRSAYARSFSHGDEIFFGGMADHWNVPAYHYDPSGTYDAVRLEVRDPFESNRVTERSCDHIHAGRHSSELLTDAALDFLADCTSETPFFAYVAYLAPHDPRTMPREYRDLYNEEDVELPPNFAGGHPFDTGALHIRDEMLAGFPRTPREIRRHIAEYYAMISHLDAQVGRIIETLETRDLLENTIIVFAGDNGLAVGQHGLLGKQSLYDHSVRVPLILAGPGLPQGERRDAFVYLTDVFPTLCELTGIPAPESVEGKSVMPLVHNAGSTLRESLYLAYSDTQRGVRRGSYKLIEYVVEGRRNMTQLFDLRSDPWEMNNLATDDAFSETLAELREELFRLRDAWGDRDTEWGERFWRAWQS